MLLKNGCDAKISIAFTFGNDLNWTFAIESFS